MSLKYSANIGFLWEHLPLPERILAAKKAGFDAVECHFPYDYPALEIATVLNDANIPMIGINTLLGPSDSSFFGVAAVQGQEELARQYIDQAIDYATVIGATHVNVVAGANDQSNRELTTDEEVFRQNLKYACDKALSKKINIVIEPLNPRSVPNYHCQSIEQGIETVMAVDAINLKLMFDVFHTQIVQGDIARLLTDYLPYIGHIQISAVHDRGEPDSGEVNYRYLLDILQENGYRGMIGAEYKPRGKSVEEGLAWLDNFRSVVQ